MLHFIPNLLLTIAPAQLAGIHLPSCDSGQTAVELFPHNFQVRGCNRILRGYEVVTGVVALGHAHLPLAWGYSLFRTTGQAIRPVE